MKDYWLPRAKSRDRINWQVKHMIKIYETDSYARECRMKVLSSGREEAAFLITVDQSVFFPEEGGQYADTGLLIIRELPLGYEGLLKVGDKASLLDGQICDDGSIAYKVSDEIPAGAVLDGILDWEKRFDRMQNHSGEHILTGVIHNKYGFNNVGFHLSDDDFVTLDLDGKLTYEQVIEMEKTANEIIYDNLPITDSYPDKAALEDISYRSKIEIDGQVRLITIGDHYRTIDVCACCAPHVLTTGCIGIIKVFSVINYKKGIQIAILCGKRALDYINKEHSALSSLSRRLSTSFDNVEKIVASYTEEIFELKARLSKLVENSISEKISELDENDPGCIFTSEELNAGNMKNIYNILTDKVKGYAGIFVGSDDEGYRYNAGGKNLDAKDLAALMREKLGAKGGGNSEMIQGKVNATKKEIIDLFKLL